MSPRVLCEVCVDSIQGIRAAVEGGADRVELCSALELGGLTPSAGLVATARRLTTLPIHAMVRPRPGDFVLDADDLEAVGADVVALCRAGVQGIVFGALTPDGDIDTDALTAVEMLAEVGGVSMTFHRAIDCARDPLAALQMVARFGVERVLTSGAAATAAEGAATIRAMVDSGAGGVKVMAGAGVRAANVVELVRATGVREVHLSASRVATGPSQFTNPRCSFAAPGRAGGERRETDAEEIRAVIAALRS